MAAHDISLDDSFFVFETVMRVRNTEINFGQYLSLDAMTSLLTEARARFFYSKGLKEVDANYQGLIVTDITLNFPTRVRAREELLFEVGVGNINHKNGSILFKVSRMFDNSLVAKAQSTFVNYDYRTNQTVDIPQEMIEILDQTPFEV